MEPEYQSNFSIGEGILPKYSVKDGTKNTQHMHFLNAMTFLA